MRADITTVLQYCSSLRLPFVEFRDGQDLDSNRILVRNCTILAVYLGLSTTYLASDGWKATKDEPSGSLLSGGKSSHAPQSLSLDSGGSPPNATHDVFYSQSERFVMQAMATTSVLEYLLTISNSSIGSYTPAESVNNTCSPDLASSSTTTSPSANVRCPKCGKSFSTVSKLNKHTRHDCKYSLKKHFPCRNPGCRRGPQRPFTCESYRNIHEQKYCKALGRRCESVLSST